MDWVKESEMFDKAADYYDKYRPSYPREIIDTLIAETQIKENSKLLEIGAGSGKATELLAGKLAHRAVNLLQIRHYRLQILV